MDSDIVAAEITKRELLEATVDEILLSRLTKVAGKRIKRGVVHTLVAEALEVGNSSRLRTLVNNRMEHLGFPRCILHGARFFRNATLNTKDAN